MSLRLLPGLAVMVLAVAVFSAYTVVQLRGLMRLQSDIIDRNRSDSLLLLRIQNDLNAIGTAMRDMVESTEPYPVSAWRSQFSRLRVDLEDALGREAQVAPAGRNAEQARYLSSSNAQFWDALDNVFTLAETSESDARVRLRFSVQARHEALTSIVARLLVQNHDQEQVAAAQVQQIYGGVERNVYLFLSAMLLVIGLTSLHLVRYNRRVFSDVKQLSDRRSELAQQLISAQENTLRSLSRELHDEFGQTLTAVGMVLQRAQRGLGAAHAGLAGELRDVHDAVQDMLENMRRLSHSLHPVILDGMGLEGALEAYIPRYESRTGIAVRFVRPPQTPALPRDTATHVYRVFQEALNNAARHSGATLVEVRLTRDGARVILEIEDDGAGFRAPERPGLGMISMRERAEILRGSVEFREGSRGGALVRLTVPVEQEIPSARAIV